MSDVWRPDQLRFLLLWVALGALSILARLLPLSFLPGDWPGPDLFAALTLAWVVRRPSHLPAPAIALMFLAEDLLLMQPPGLGAALMLAATEFLRRRATVVRELNLLLEWGMVAAVQVAVYVAGRVVLAIVMLPRPPLDLSLLALIFTLGSYPLVVALLTWVLRVRKPAMGEVDELGRKL